MGKLLLVGVCAIYGYMVYGGMDEASNLYVMAMVALVGAVLVLEG